VNHTQPQYYDVEIYGGIFRIEAEGVEAAIGIAVKRAQLEAGRHSARVDGQFYTFKVERISRAANIRKTS